MLSPEIMSGAPASLSISHDVSRSVEGFLEVVVAVDVTTLHPVTASGTSAPEAHVRHIREEEQQQARPDQSAAGDEETPEKRLVDPSHLRVGHDETEHSHRAQEQACTHEPL